MAKRGKKGIVRAYDKALQLGLDDLRAYRIETEIRHKHAHICSKRIANGETIASVMNSKFFIDKKWYRDLLGSDISTSRFKDLHKEEIAPIDAKMQWLMRAVTPTLQYVIDYDKANGTSNFASILEKLNFD
jgi:DNA relaxase NicK